MSLSSHFKTIFKCHIIRISLKSQDASDLLQNMTLNKRKIWESTLRRNLHQLLNTTYWDHLGHFHQGIKIDKCSYGSWAAGKSGQSSLREANCSWRMCPPKLRPDRCFMFGVHFHRHISINSSLRGMESHYSPTAKLQSWQRLRRK